MKRVAITERPNWRAQAIEFGFNYHTMYGEPYWCEDYYYTFSLAEIETIEDATTELHQMALEAVAKVVSSEALMVQFGLPKSVWNFVRDSWAAQEPTLYGRFDFAYDGRHPPKMLEYNADTPTSLYETALFQWLWLEDQIAAGNLSQHHDQFNSLQEKMIERLAFFKSWHGMQHLHFACCADSVEDRGTVQYLQDCAVDAGLDNSFVYMEDIGLGDNGAFTDVDDRVIDAVFKLYPWEFMFREEFAAHLNSAKTLWIEPGWKSILSNKALLPLLWQMFPNHPNLLAAYFEGEPQAQALTRYVRKPFFSREGANVTIMDGGAVISSADGPYGAEGAIIQEYYPLPQFAGNYTLVGSWVVGDDACGLCIREDTNLITQDLSRFYPHVICD